MASTQAPESPRKLKALQVDYEVLGGDNFAKRDTEPARRRAISQLEGLGYRVTLEVAA